MTSPEPLPLFPLQSVLFPGGLLNLKVFEARYLDLVSACLREQREFGVVCLRQGTEVGQGKVAFEDVGVMARLIEVDSAQAGILQVRCQGGPRFRILGSPRQQDDGLWLAPRLEILPGDQNQVPAPEVLASVAALARAIARLRSQGALPFLEPLSLDNAGWVANRWCEILPIPLAAKQKLMALEDPAIRLQLVHDYLRGKGVIPQA